MVLGHVGRLLYSWNESSGLRVEFSIGEPLGLGFLPALSGSRPRRHGRAGAANGLIARNVGVIPLRQGVNPGAAILELLAGQMHVA